MDRDHGHLNKVAWWTAKFAGEMFPAGSEEAKATQQWGYLAGLWHDLGKFAPAWQSYLRKKTDSNIHTDDVLGTVDHSTAGAQFADRSFPKLGRLIAYLIAGHHPGLANGEDGDAPQSSLKERLRKPVAEYGETLPREVSSYRPMVPLPQFAMRSGQSLAFFLRFLFSCLTDADFLATERFMNPVQSSKRSQEQPSMSEMETALTRHLDELATGAAKTKVNQRRAEILKACLFAAERPPGLFSLTVPTGGGKTLSSLAFALKHARLHDLRRVIYAIHRHKKRITNRTRLREGPNEEVTHMITRAPVLFRRSTPVSFQKTRATAEARGKKSQYRPLPKEFRHDGLIFRQIACEGGAAIYEQRCSGCAELSVCYEVIRVRRRGGFQIGGRFVEPAEIYPKAEAWGVDGFTFTDKDAAFAKFREIKSKRTHSRSSTQTHPDTAFPAPRGNQHEQMKKVIMRQTVVTDRQSRSHSEAETT